MSITIELENNQGPALAFQMFGKDGSISTGTEIEAPGGIKLTLTEMRECRSIGVASVLAFVVDASVAIDIGLFSAWLYDQVKSPNSVKIKIKEREVHFDKGEITKAIEREIEYSE